MKIGLTGGIGSGKSTVAHLFMELGIPVYFADEEARKLMNKSKIIRKKLISEFGQLAFNEDGLNRKYLADIVFKDKDKLTAINKIVHPEVRKNFSSWVSRQDAPYVIQENAILFESGMASQFDHVIVVMAPLKIRMERVMERDGISEQDFLARVNNQWAEERKIEQADFSIDNFNF